MCSWCVQGYGFWLYTIGGTPPDIRHAPAGAPTTWTTASGEVLPLVEPCVLPDADARMPMEPAFIGLTITICLLSRACSVFPLAALANCCRSPEKRIRIHEQAVIWFSGLRGAIALALAVEFPTAASVPHNAPPGNFCYQREHVVACTIVVVMATVFVLGGLTKPVLTLCGVQMGLPPEDEAEEAEGDDGAHAEPPAAREREATRDSRLWWKRAVVAFDHQVLRPVLVAKKTEERKRLPEERQPMSPTPTATLVSTPFAQGGGDDAAQAHERL